MKQTKKPRPQAVLELQKPPSTQKKEAVSAMSSGGTGDRALSARPKTELKAQKLQLSHNTSTFKEKKMPAKTSPIQSKSPISVRSQVSMEACIKNSLQKVVQDKVSKQIQLRLEHNRKHNKQSLLKEKNQQIRQNNDSHSRSAKKEALKVLLAIEQRQIKLQKEQPLTQRQPRTEVVAEHSHESSYLDLSLQKPKPQKDTVNLKKQQRVKELGLDFLQIQKELHSKKDPPSPAQKLLREFIQNKKQTQSNQVRSSTPKSKPKNGVEKFSEQHQKMQKLKKHQSNFELIVEKQRVLQNLKSLQSHCSKKKSKQSRHINRLGKDVKIQQQPGFLTKRESNKQSTDQPRTLTPRCIRTDASPTQSSRLRKKRSSSKSKKTEQTSDLQFTSQEMAVFLFVNQAVSRIQRAFRNFMFRKKQQRRFALETQRSAQKKQVRLQKLQQAIEVAKQQKQRQGLLKMWIQQNQEVFDYRPKTKILESINSSPYKFSVEVSKIEENTGKNEILWEVNDVSGEISATRNQYDDSFIASAAERTDRIMNYSNVSEELLDQTVAEATLEKSSGVLIELAAINRSTSAPQKEETRNSTFLAAIGEQNQSFQNQSQEDNNNYYVSNYTSSKRNNLSSEDSFLLNTQTSVFSRNPFRDFTQGRLQDLLASQQDVKELEQMREEALKFVEKLNKGFNKRQSKNEQLSPAELQRNKYEFERWVSDSRQISAETQGKHLDFQRQETARIIAEVNKKAELIKLELGKAQFFEEKISIKVEESKSSKDEIDDEILADAVATAIFDELMEAEILNQKNFAELLTRKEEVSEQIVAGIDTGPESVEQYVESIFVEIRTRADQFLNAFYTPIYRSPLEVLQALKQHKPGQVQIMLFDASNTLTSILNVQLYLTLERARESIIKEALVQIREQAAGQKIAQEGQLEELLSEADHIHNKAVFDAVNEVMNEIRPYGKQGEPLPWSRKPRKNFFIIGEEEQLQKILDIIRTTILGHANTRAGASGQEYSDTSRLEQIASQNPLGSVIKQHITLGTLTEQTINHQREKTLDQMLQSELAAGEQQWLDYEDEETQVKLDASELVMEVLVAEAVQLLTEINQRKF